MNQQISSLSQKLELLKNIIPLKSDKEFITNFQILVEYYHKHPDIFEMIANTLKDIYIKN